MLLMASLPMPGFFTASAEPAPQQQSQTVSTIEGTVYDENNEAVIGASVAVKGTRGNAVATDAFGHFKLRVTPGAELIVSYVGYKTATVAATNGVTIYLEPTTEQLNELVAIGYGSQKKANLTGAVSTVDVARTMDSRPVADVARALQGAVPGLTITTSSGDISANPQINIRGVGTLSNDHSSNPLIVVDGVPGGGHELPQPRRHRRNKRPQGCGLKFRLRYTRRLRCDSYHNQDSKQERPCIGKLQ